jgi:hypothetical protein
MAIPSVLALLAWYFGTHAKEPGTETPAFVLLGGHALLPFVAVVLRWDRPWRLLAVGVGLMLVLDWAMVFVTFPIRCPPGAMCEGTALPAIFMAMFTPCYVAFAAVVGGVSAAIFRKSSRGDESDRGARQSAKS